MSQKIEISILGQRYLIKSDQDEAQLRDVAQYVDSKLRELSRSGPTNTLNVAILGALNIANEYHLYRRHMEESLQQMDARCNRLDELMKRHPRPPASSVPGESDAGSLEDPGSVDA